MSKLTLFATLLGCFGLLGSATAIAADVEQNFKFYCAQCHGETGLGDGPNVTESFATDPRNFTNAAEMEKLTDADIKNVILDGGPSVSKSELMPPWSRTLTEEEVDALVAYLRQLCQCQATQ